MIGFDSRTSLTSHKRQQQWTMDKTMDLVKDYMFAPKTRPTLNNTTSSESSSNSCSSSSHLFGVSSSSSAGLLLSMTSTASAEDNDDEQNNHTRSIGSSTATAGDDSVISDIASPVNNNNKNNHDVANPEDAITNETITTTTPSSSSSSPLPPAIPLRPNSKSAIAARRNKNTNSDDAMRILVQSSSSTGSTSGGGGHDDDPPESSFNQQQPSNNSSSPIQQPNPYLRHDQASSSSSLPDRNTETVFFNRAMMSSTRTTATASSSYHKNNSRNISFGINNNSNCDHGDNDYHDNDDDILGRLMSHSVTANWMLQQKNYDHSRNTTCNGSAAAAAAGWPMICVVGDTSSGKSSLLCQLSGIELPTNHQLTTRCPILLHMARKPQQQRQPAKSDDNDDNSSVTKMATIHIQWRSNNRLQNHHQTQQWKERICTDQNWHEIPSTILEAQEFILEQTGKQVAPDIVRVNVAYYDTNKDDDGDDEKKSEEEEVEQQNMQHDHPYLTLLDLPGLVQTAAADESPTLVHEIQFLVRSYIQSPQTLILAVLSCTTDFHNAQVLAEILHGNNNNNNNDNSNNNLAARTIPVLTKPDLMDAGAPEIMLRDDLLLGGKQLLPRVVAAAPATSTTTTAPPTTTIQSSWSDDLAPSATSNSTKNYSRGNNSTTNNPFTFHMVKGRGQAALDRGDSIEQGLRDEVHFFETREPWKSVANRTLFGTRHLQAKLAQLQHDVVRQTTLPRLHRDIQERQLALQMELQELIGGNTNSSIKVDAESGMPLAVMLETQADRRRYYQQVCQNLVASLQASLSGKKQRTSTTSSIASTRSTRLAYQKQLQQLNSCMGSSCSSASSQDDVATAATSIRSATLTASAKLHEACNQFCQEVQRGSLATIKQIVEGAHVDVTAPSSSNNNRSSAAAAASSGGAVRQVRGEVVHLDQTFACVDYIDPADAQSDILFENTRSTMFSNAAVEDVIEENDVWSDGNRVFIARRDGVYDTLKQIPLDRIRTHPGWLKDKIQENRTDDLGCFLNADIFQCIVADFIEEDWRPRCLDLLDRMREILQVTVKHVVQETTGGGGISGSGSCRPGSNRTRYPGLQRHLVQQCRKVAEEWIQQAYQQVEAHLAMEKQHPYTQDHSLFQNMAQARHANLKRDLEVALRLDPQPSHLQQQQASSMKLSNKAPSTMNTSRDAIQNIIDEVFERHSKKSVEDHMAEEMEIVLEAYGSIATRRVMDRTPMICWQVFRSITAAIQDALYCNVTDEILEKQILRQAPDFEKRYSQLTEELKEWNHALEIVESVM